MTHFEPAQAIRHDHGGDEYLDNGGVCGARVCGYGCANVVQPPGLGGCVDDVHHEHGRVHDLTAGGYGRVHGVRPNAAMPQCPSARLQAATLA